MSIYLKDLKKSGIPFIPNLTDENQFIANHGIFNCKYLWFKDSESVISEIKAAYPEENFEQEVVDFIAQNSGKRVLCYLCHSWEYNPDIFVFGENNTPFTVNCFQLKEETKP